MWPLKRYTLVVVVGGGGGGWHVKTVAILVEQVPERNVPSTSSQHHTHLIILPSHRRAHTTPPTGGRIPCFAKRNQQHWTWRMTNHMARHTGMGRGDCSKHLEGLGALDPGEGTFEHRPPTAAHDEHINPHLCSKAAEHVSWVSPQSYTVHHIESLQQLICKCWLMGGTGRGQGRGRVDGVIATAPPSCCNAFKGLY